MRVWSRLAAIVAEHGAGALVRLHQIKGSAPRDAGAAMVVRPDGAFHGTIGGGRLEWLALRDAQDALEAGRGPARFRDWALGPDLGQCCGGRATVVIETFDTRDGDALGRLAALDGEGMLELSCSLGPDGRVRRTLGPPPEMARPAAGWVERHGEARTPLLLFGAGHVGRALVLALAPLPFAVRWIDSRHDAFPAHIPGNATPVRRDDPAAELRAAAAGSLALVMTHDHALDLDITAAALRRPDLPFVGLIGSETKRARFVTQLHGLGLPPARIAALVCPIGLAGIQGKEPAAIAASVAAQLLQVRERFAAAAPLAGAAREAASPKKELAS